MRGTGMLRRSAAWAKGKALLRSAAAMLRARPDWGRALVPAAPAVPVREIFRQFWPFARPYRRWLWLALIVVAIQPAIDTALIWMYQILIDRVLLPRDFRLFLWVALAYVGLTLLDQLFSFLDEYCFTWLSERFLLDMRTHLLKHLHSLSLDFFDQRKLGDILTRLSSDVDAIESLVLSGVADFLSYAFRILFFGVAIFVLRWDLALAALMLAPLFGLVVRHFSQRTKQVSRELRQRGGAIMSVAEESLSNAMLVQAYNRQRTEAERFGRETQGNFLTQMVSVRLHALYSTMTNFIGLGATLVVTGMGIWEMAAGRLSLGELLAFLAFLSQLYSPIQSLSSFGTSIYAASAGAERIIEYLDQRPSVVERPDARELVRARGDVRFDHVDFRYTTGNQNALSDLSFRVRPGQCLALVGPSGAGKSSVAKLLLRFYDPTAGAVRIDGRDLRELSLHSLRENIAVVLQETMLLDGTVRENIAYGRTEATEEEIVRAARAADAHDFILELPDGYDTIVGQRGRRLSGGQRQRIAIARAMVRDAPILILDEPTTGLDVEARERILEPLRRLMRGRTTIIISHDIVVAREATRILVLDGGREVERGTHDELLASGGTYARMYQLQMFGVGDPAVQAPAPADASMSPISWPALALQVERPPSAVGAVDAVAAVPGLSGMRGPSAGVS